VIYSAQTIAALIKVDKNANPEFKQFAFECVRALAQCRSQLTADDLAELMAQYPDAPTTHDNRALGAVMQKAAKAGLIVATSELAPGRRANRHNSPCRVWKSLIFAPPNARTLPLFARLEQEQAGA
jgi:hypothetical protein